MSASRLRPAAACPRLRDRGQHPRAGDWILQSRSRPVLSDVRRRAGRNAPAGPAPAEAASGRGKDRPGRIRICRIHTRRGGHPKPVRVTDVGQPYADRGGGVTDLGKRPDHPLDTPFDLFKIALGCHEPHLNHVVSTGGFSAAAAHAFPLDFLPATCGLSSPSGRPDSRRPVLMISRASLPVLAASAVLASPASGALVKWQGESGQQLVRWHHRCRHQLGQRRHADRRRHRPHLTARQPRRERSHRRRLPGHRRVHQPQQRVDDGERRRDGE